VTALSPTPTPTGPAVAATRAASAGDPPPGAARAGALWRRWVRVASQQPVALGVGLQPVAVGRGRFAAPAPDWGTSPDGAPPLPDEDLGDNPAGPAQHQGRARPAQRRMPRGGEHFSAPRGRSPPPGQVADDRWWVPGQLHEHGQCRTCPWARQARNIGSLAKGTTWIGPGEGPRDLEGAILGHSLKIYGCRAHRVRVPGAQRVAGGPVGWDRRRRDRVHQRHLVDAL
jgi:hypothetical protein